MVWKKGIDRPAGARAREKKGIEARPSNRPTGSRVREKGIDMPRKEICGTGLFSVFGKNTLSGTDRQNRFDRARES